MTMVVGGHEQGHMAFEYASEDSRGAGSQASPGHHRRAPRRPHAAWISLRGGQAREQLGPVASPGARRDAGPRGRGRGVALERGDHGSGRAEAPWDHSPLASASSVRRESFYRPVRISRLMEEKPVPP